MMMTDDDEKPFPRSDDSLTFDAGDHASAIPDIRPFARTDRALATLCGEQDPGSLWCCTRSVDHDGDHIAGIGRYHVGEHILARWAK